ncbi:MAG TPA: DUF3788 family protein [Phycisphaerae bacterium]|nr:DUF3788 family protein [Phycisphaerae bacterium]
MEEPVFPDKKQPPAAGDLTRAFGKAKRHWDDLAGHISSLGPAAKPEWKHYGKRSGWVYVLRGKKNNLLYLIPHEKHFVASFAFGEKAVRAALESDLPAPVVEMVRQSPKYPEGRAVRLKVTSAADVKIAKRLLAIKLDN